MGGVGDEAALGVEGGFEPAEEPVDGVGQVFDLVAGARKGESLVEVVLGDLLGGGGHGA